MVSNVGDEQFARNRLAVVRAVAQGELTAEAGGNLERWMREPQYAEYHERLSKFVEGGRFAELNRLFWERIPFGTGGRRGPMGEFGSATINDRTIAESAHGLAEYVLQCRRQTERTGVEAEPRAVVACDSRHRSTEFARRTATVFAAHEFRVYFFPEPRATPELSFAVRFLGCDTGVMISASHNPPSDNGFKAYWSTGGQVLPPHDAGIIRCVDAATDIPTLDFDEAVASGQIVLLRDDVDQAYINAVCSLSLSSERNMSALYTPLHGVGESSVFRAVQQAGFHGVSIFELQRQPDGTFPNVPDHLPNPERHAVFGPAIKESERTGVDLILASDPDADRMAVAVRDRTGQYVCLTGNQLAALLTDYVLGQRSAAGTLSPSHFIVETLVTTPLVAAIGASHGVKVVRDVLVGFKNIAAEVDAHGVDRFVFAVEESIGFMAGDYCRDKDAAIGALFVLELAAELKRVGKTLLDRLRELHQTHGFFLEETLSTTCPGPEGQARIQRIMAAFREHPPFTVGRCSLESVRDYQRHEVRSVAANRAVEALPKPSGDLLIFEGLAGEHRCEITVAMRPSGTEPKIKFYYFVQSDSQPSVEAARDRAVACLNDLTKNLAAWMDAVV